MGNWLDALYLSATSRVHLFSKGWGELEDVEAAARPLLEPHESKPLQLEWSQHDARAPSPCDLLLEGNQHALIRRLPARGEVKARIIVPPSWGDESWGRRTFWLSGLAALGVEAWLLEGAYFGKRRPRSHGNEAFLTVRDFVVMGLANVLEARAAATAARELSPNVPVALVGYSMGGQLVAQTAATLPWEIPVIAVAPPDSAAPVFCEGPLGKSIRHDVLGEGSHARLNDIFTRMSVHVLPPPRSKQLAILATKRDGIVPPSAMERLAKHWGITPRWLNTGHLGAYVFHRRTLRDTVREVLKLS